MAVDLSALLTVADYQQRRQHIFPSRASFDWQLKTHREGLAKCGGLVVLAGSLYLHPERADAYFYEDGQKRAAKSKRPGRREVE